MNASIADIAAAQQEAERAGLTLRRDEHGLALTLENGSMELRTDFADELPRLKHGIVQRELLVRAAKTAKPASGASSDAPLAVDATAGLGFDALLLAAAGFRVLMFENNPVMAALLDDALSRATKNPSLAPFAARMTLIAADSVQELPRLAERPHVVYLDPMFPERRKSAAVKKKFQLLHKLERPCNSECALLAAARASHPRKIIIKRPAKGPYLANAKPSYSLSGKTVRYDVIALPPHSETRV